MSQTIHLTELDFAIRRINTVLPKEVQVYLHKNHFGYALFRKANGKVSCISSGRITRAEMKGRLDILEQLVFESYDEVYEEEIIND